MQGELAATAVNAPMVPAEVLAELQPFVALALGLGRAAVQLVGSHGFTDVHITYATPRGGSQPPNLIFFSPLSVCPCARCRRASCQDTHLQSHSKAQQITLRCCIGAPCVSTVGQFLPTCHRELLHARRCHLLSCIRSVLSLHI